MAEWRFSKGWSAAELEERVAALPRLDRNFDVHPQTMTTAEGWHAYRSQATLAHERAGPPLEDGFFERGSIAIANFQFSDPDIVLAHFVPEVRLRERRMLLELKAMGLHYLCGTAVGEVIEERTERRSTFGYRYDTLEGHIERGAEWFLLSKDHESGAIEFIIRARWRPGDFPNWWSRLGFALLGRYYQKRWHVHAHWRLYALMHEPKAALRRRGRLTSEGPDVAFAFEKGIRQ